MEYKLTGKVTISVYTVVKAESEEEAIRIGEDRDEIESDQWGDENQQNYVWVSDEYDGDVHGVEIEK